MEKTELDSKIETEAVEAVQGDELWRAHIGYAANFMGSNEEYCKRNGLSFRDFKSYKAKLGLTKRRGRRSTAFLKIGRDEESAERVATKSLRVREPSLPDAKWVAEFVMALMRQK